MDPYRGLRLWEEGVFINGRLEGAGKYGFLDAEGCERVREGMFRGGEISEDEDDDWSFRKKTKTVIEVQTSAVDQLVASGWLRRRICAGLRFASLKLI